MRENDVLFFNLHRRYTDTEPRYGGFMGIYLLSAFLNENGYLAQGFSGALLEGKKIIDEACQDGKVSMIGLYCDYANITENAFLSRYIKDTYDIPVIVGGPQATALGEKFLKDSFCDALVRYEGELTVLDLAECLLDGTKELSEIQGIMYMDGEKCVLMPERPVIQNLDGLPRIDDSCYLRPKNRANELDIMTGRGCPFHCAFCHEGNHTRQVRFRSPEKVLEEIGRFLETHHRKGKRTYLVFVDDTFTLVPDRVKKICYGLKEFRKKYDFIWYCEGHIHSLYKHPEMIDYMADAGLIRLQLGIEAGTQEVLDAYGKGCTAEETKEVIRHSISAGIRQVFGNIILGGALFSRKIYEKELQFGKELIRESRGVVELNVVTYWPLAETPMTTDPEKFGIHVCDTDFYTSAEDYPQSYTEELSQADIFKMQQDMKKEFSDCMFSVLRNNEVPEERVLYWITDAYRYGAYGMWMTVLQRMPALKAYYEMLECGEAMHWNDLPLLDKEESHPMRVTQMGFLVERKSHGWILQGREITDFQMKVLLHCAGRLSVKAIVDKLASEGSYPVAEMAEKVRACLKDYEDKRVVLYSPY